MTESQPTSEGRRARWRRFALAGLLAGNAVAHLVNPEFYDPMIPEWLPTDAATTNRLAAVAEGGSALLLASRRTARVGGLAALATFLVVWPGNIHMAVQRGWPGPEGGETTTALLWARLPLQLPLLWWSWQTYREADHG